MTTSPSTATEARHARRYWRIREALTARRAAHHVPRHREVSLRDAFSRVAKFVKAVKAATS